MTVSVDIATVEFTDLIKQILKKYGLDFEKNFMFHDDPYQWAMTNGEENIKVDDCAFYSYKKNLIVLKKSISREKMKNILEGIDARVFFITPRVLAKKPSSSVLNTDEKFVQHTLLHEIGHSKGHRDEASADVYAFGEINFKVSPIDYTKI